MADQNFCARYFALSWKLLTGELSTQLRWLSRMTASTSMARACAIRLSRSIRNGADVFITGEIKYHDYFGHDTDILLAEIGHYESEQYTKEIFYTIIRELFPNLALQQCKVNTNPIKYL